MSAGESAQHMIVFELPPRAFWRSCVSFELRNGMNTFFFGLFACSASAVITLPKADSDWLIAAPSLRRSPVAPVDSARSEPARSMRLRSEPSSFFRPSSVTVCTTRIVTTVCARLDVAFICVDATVRELVPVSMHFSISLYDPTAARLRPST